VVKSTPFSPPSFSPPPFSFFRMSGTVPLYQVDAFTSRPFEGNPAAICLLTEDLPVDMMKAIAAEMNLSETAFVRPIHEHKDRMVTGEGAGEAAGVSQQYCYSLRWFTPVVEVPLCGHATLATAHVIFKSLPPSVTSLTFQTLSGDLVAERSSSSTPDGFYSIFLPTADTIPFAEANLSFPNFEAVLNATIGSTPVHEIRYVPSRKRVLVRLADDVGRQGLELLNPNLSSMTSLHDGSLLSSVTVTVCGKVGDTLLPPSPSSDTDLVD